MSCLVLCGAVCFECASRLAFLAGVRLTWVLLARVWRVSGARAWSCVWVAWINGRGERREPVSAGSLLSPLFFFCGADDGTRTRCLHLGRVALILLSFIRSVLPGCSLAFACVGGGADDGTRTRCLHLGKVTL